MSNKLEPQKVNAIIHRILQLEAQNLRTQENSRTKMIDKIINEIKEELECY